MSALDRATWEPTYRKILADFGYDPAADEAARDALGELLADALRIDADQLRDDLHGREVFVIGGAARTDDLARVPTGVPFLVTDGAADAVLPHARPTAIVTDLDGDVALQIAANALGVPVFLHAHGDNLDALRMHARAFHGEVQGTTQAAPAGPIANYGGFTDGDRACCIAAHHGASALALIGFDYDDPKEKTGRERDVKLRKLAWARRIIEGLGLPVRYA